MSEFLNPIFIFVELGGPVVAILLFLSVGALALIGIKAVKFVYCKVGSHKNAIRALGLWNNRKRTDALNLVSNSKSALDKTLSVAMQKMSAGKLSKEEVEEEVSAVAVRELHELQRGFRALESIAQIAPLLGLFGTVLGMIDAFQKLQSAGNSVDPSILAGGIWVALLTTAAGLAVAMPISLVLTWFETRLEDERIAIQVMSSNLIGSNAGLAEDPVAETAEQTGAAYAH
ncbi:MAG: MotA/TolQ/ExbB proton channel family protein [Pseudomonadota bacterium]